jgi:regulator of nucleoside diphosphate kinase
MSTTSLPRLTPRDFTILETMLADHLGGDEMLISAIRKKLKFAQIVFAEDLPADVVTVGSRVAFTVDSQWPQERRLTPIVQYVAGQDHQTLASLRGVELLGQSEGDSTELDYGTRVECLEIHKVLYQPEAEIKKRKRPVGVHLVSSRSDSRPSGAVRPRPLPENDPGPSAA